MQHREAAVLMRHVKELLAKQRATVEAKKRAVVAALTAPLDRSITIVSYETGMYKTTGRMKSAVLRQKQEANLAPRR